MSRFAHVACATFSDRGLVREQNEDAVFVLPEVGVFGVSDGMGGGEAGELASAWVVDEIQTALSGTSNESPGVRLSAAYEAINRANGRIRAYASEKAYKMMGATVALLLLNPWDASAAYVVHAGDSRVYRLRDGVLERLTEDHTIGVDIAKMTGDGMMADHRASHLSHVLTRAVGTSEAVSPESLRVAVEKNDVFLVCTDGVSTMLDDGLLREIIVSAGSPESIVERISDSVRDAGAIDNYSMAACCISGALPPSEIHAEDELQESDYLEERCKG